jgi:single-strand DNA-binding protein
LSVNRVTLIGNLGADPETRSSTSGTTIATLRVATSERVKVGEVWEDHTEWHKVVAFGKLAENAARFLTKGRQVYVEGKLRTRKWQDKDGNDRYSTEIVADGIVFLGGGSGERPERAGARGPADDGGAW